MEIGGKKIGDGQPTFIIAEIGVNHNGNIQMAKELIDIAADTKVDAVKFQSFVPEELYSSVAAPKGIDFLKPYELSWDNHLELAGYAKNKNIMFLSTPFDYKSADLLNKINVPAFKIASGEITDPELLAYIAGFKRPMIISSGSKWLADVEKARSVIYNAGIRDIAILHCVSAYPAPDIDLNLNVIDTYLKVFPDDVIGYSDHSTGTEAAVIAVCKGAKIIEKHFTLDKSLPGPDHRASSDPDELQKLVQAIRRAEIMTGKSNKTPQPSECRNTRSLTATRNIKKGEFIQSSDITTKRPATGIEPAYKAVFTGKQAKREIKFDELLSWDMI